MEAHPHRGRDLPSPIASAIGAAIGDTDRSLKRRSMSSTGRWSFTKLTWRRRERIWRAGWRSSRPQRIGGRSPAARRRWAQCGHRSHEEGARSGARDRRETWFDRASAEMDVWTNRGASRFDGRRRRPTAGRHPGLERRIAHVAPIDQMQLRDWQRSLDVNATGHSSRRAR